MRMQVTYRARILPPGTGARQPLARIWRLQSPRCKGMSHACAAVAAPSHRTEAGAHHQNGADLLRAGDAERLHTLRLDAVGCARRCDTAGGPGGWQHRLGGGAGRGAEHRAVRPVAAGRDRRPATARHPGAQRGNAAPRPVRSIGQRALPGFHQRAGRERRRDRRFAADAIPDQLVQPRLFHRASPRCFPGDLYRPAVRRHARRSCRHHHQSQDVASGRNVRRGCRRRHAAGIFPRPVQPVAARTARIDRVAADRRHQPHASAVRPERCRPGARPGIAVARVPADEFVACRRRGRDRSRRSPLHVQAHWRSAACRRCRAGDRGYLCRLVGQDDVRRVCVPGGAAGQWGTGRAVPGGIAQARDD